MFNSWSIFEKVKNGSKSIFFSDDTGHFYRTLSGAKRCLVSDRINQPKKLNNRWHYLGNGKWKKEFITHHGGNR
tara:strand:- start:2847 stop:3068 length:222 start_codon:yes stop_codon:yes gene_type:complete